MDWLASNWKPIVVAAVAITTTLLSAGLAAPGWDALVTASFEAAAGGFAAGVVNSALNGGNLGDMISAGVYGGEIGSVIGFLTPSLGGLIGKLAPNSGDPVPLSVTNPGLYKDLLGAVGPVASAASSFIAPIMNTNGMLSTPTPIPPSPTRDWLEYNAAYNPNKISSSGTLDWVHYDEFGRKTVTSYDAISGSGSKKYFGRAINQGDWTGNNLESSPFTQSLDDKAYYNREGTFGFKVRLTGNFGRTGILIHPGMYGGTQGCIGLSNEDQLMNFYNRIVNYNLSTTHTINVHVNYSN
jgi:hypothetical protein